MEVEKRGVKGGFFQLFDWNVKSRKKLFSSKSESTEISHQGKENVDVSTIVRHQGPENGFPLGARYQNDYHYASSASGDSDCGTKAPGVVARLMGLDSLPMSNANEPCFTPFIESHSFRDSGYMRAAPAFQGEHDIVIFESVRNKLDGLTRNPWDLGMHKVQSRPIERFQREVIPPKSAKPISVTHHRLLSPIKSPGFIPPKNAAYIMEAASKIIEQSPRSIGKSKLPPLGSSSVPLRICDLKEKMEAAQKSSRSSDASQKSREQSSNKNAKKQLSGRGQGLLEDSHTYKVPDESKRMASQRLKNKEKPVSVAIHVKGNLQRRDSFGDRSSDRQREHHENKASGSSRNFSSTQKKMGKPSSSRKLSDVLRLNHQKQNRASAEEAESSESSNSHPKERKESNTATNYDYGRTNRTINKIVVNHVVTSRKTNFTAADPGKEGSSSRVQTISKKRQPVNENIQSSGNFTQKPVVMKNEPSVKCNIEFQGDSKWDTIDNKSSLDVVSFTFTSPVKKSGAGSNSCSSVSEGTSSDLPDHDSFTQESGLRNSVASSSRFSVIRGDALSVLLEQKLKELTSRIELAQEDKSEGGSSSSYGRTGPTSNLVNSLSVNDDTRKGKQEIQNSSISPLVDVGLECTETSANESSTEYYTYLDLRGSTSVSCPPSFSGSFTDSFYVDRSSCEGSVQGLSLESEKMTWTTTKKSQTTEGDFEISDTASSLSVGTAFETAASNAFAPFVEDSSFWELKYISDVLSSSDLLMLEQFALGHVHHIISPDLFDHLENQRMDSDKVTEERFPHERKVLFDCVAEFLEIHCSHLLAGSSQLWAKETAVLRRRQWMAEEVYRDVSSWTNIEESMVDELVDKDMSSKGGKWIDFEIEAFEEGVEIGKRILTCLIDELIDDFLV